jgi:ATPase subunit of ABC transporter with duplicated ATPase domains
VGVIEVNGVGYALPGGRVLLRDVAFRVGDGEHVALVGANGTGKTTLLRIIAGDLDAQSGHARTDGDLRIMRQLLSEHRTELGPAGAFSVRDLLLGVSPPAVRAAGVELRHAQDVAEADSNQRNGLRVARAWANWGDVGGYDHELQWEECARVALGASLDEVVDRPLSTLSGGEQKRLALEVLLRSDADVLVLDEPDNFLDVPAKEWLERSLVACSKTILFVSHDRELLARTAHKIVTIEGNGCWTHGKGFDTYGSARDARLAKLDDEHRRHHEESARLEAALREFRRRSQMSDVFASRVRSTKSKIERHDAAVPRQRPKEQLIEMRLGGDRTGKRALVCDQLELAGLTEPFDLEVWFGERVGIIGHNGTGKSHFLRLLAGEEVEHEGVWKLGARVVPGYFSQLHLQPDLQNTSLVDILIARRRTRGEAMAVLRRYELQEQWQQPFETLSGGQLARFQILLLELTGATMLLLDEPTDNLDLVSAESLEAALCQFQGTVLMVTHDRWLMRTCDRFVIFGSDCVVGESPEPVYR